MTEPEAVYLEKAPESLVGAQSECTNGRYNNCANRAYYACFQAAVSALIEAGSQPPKGAKHWGHDFVRARFDGDLINRRKLYPAAVAGALEQGFRPRARADYGLDRVPELQAARAVRRAEALFAAVAQTGGRQHER